MRVFKCKNLGHDCSWKETAGTDDLLLEKVAIHLRETHGILAVYPEMMNSIHRAFEGVEQLDEEKEIDAASVELKEFRCADIGQKCSFHYIAMTEDLIADGVALHAREEHGIQEFTPEMVAQVKNSIHPWQI